ncbi:MAG: ABC1 kinase family protein [Halobacteriota archaeon]
MQRVRSLIRTLGRFLVANYVLTPIIVQQIRDRRRFILFGGRRDLSPEQRWRRATRLADAFERLGVSYIKLAQFMTTRPDLVPPTYVRALERLQDEVPAVPYEKIRPVLEEDLGDPDLIFDYFERDAISGASIAQVHRASIRGEQVAVKIRRPGLEKTIEADLRVMGFFAPIAMFALKLMGQKSHSESAKGITAELTKTLREEIDFSREANIMQELRKSFERDGLDDDIIVPYVYPEYTSERVITMSYEEGTKVKYDEELRQRGHDLDDVVEKIAEAYLHMAFTYEVFQADPHQGNLAVNEDGQVIIYDYGLAQRPDPETRRIFTDMFVGVGLHDPDQVIDALNEMGAVDPSMDRDTLRYVAEIMIQDISGQSVSDADIKEIESQVDQTLYDYPMKFPQEIVLGMRTTFGIEGLCARMAPDYDFSEHLYHFFVGQGIVELEDVEEQIVGDGIGPRLMRRADEYLGNTSFFDDDRPILEFVGRNPELLERLPLGGAELNGVAGQKTTRLESGELGMGKASTNGHFDTSDLKNHIDRKSKETSKRNAMSLFGAAMFITGAVLYSSAAPLWWTFFGVGGLAFYLVKRSFREGGNVLGPKYVATRHRIEQWEEDVENAGPGDEDDVYVDDLDRQGELTDEYAPSPPPAPGDRMGNGHPKPPAMEPGGRPREAEYREIR